jgi:hypothetical protein
MQWNQMALGHVKWTLDRLLRCVRRPTAQFSSPLIFTASANSHRLFVGCAKFQTDRCWSSALASTVRSQATLCAVFVGQFWQVFLFVLLSSPVDITPPITHKLSFFYRLRNWQHNWIERCKSVIVRCMRERIIWGGMGDLTTVAIYRVAQKNVYTLYSSISLE